MPSKESNGNDNSLVLRVPEEDHTLGNMISNVLWSHPHIIIAQYAQKHPVNREEITLHCRTDSHISARQGLTEAVETTRSILSEVSGAMTKAVDRFME